MTKILSRQAFDDIDDKLYFNFDITSNTFKITDTSNSLTPTGNFAVQYDRAILNRPKDYYMTVVRFQTPTQDVPLFIPDIYDIANDPNITVYEIALTYGITTHTAKVSWVTQDNTGGVLGKNYYWLYNYDLFLNMVNTTLVNLFALFTMPIGSLPPYFIFDPTTRLFSIVAQEQFYGVNAINPIGIILNYPLLALVNNIAVNVLTSGANGATFKVQMLKNANNYYQPPNLAAVNPPVYLINTQSQSSIVNWTPLRSVQLISSSLPIVQEFIPSPQNSSILGGVSIIKDFVPLLNNTEAPSSGIEFVNEGPYQLINLTGEAPITKMDLSCRWSDKYGNTYPILIPYNQTLSIKIAFIKKSTFTS